MKAIAGFLVRKGKIGLGALMLGCSLAATTLSSNGDDQQFLWGVSTSAYQVEGAYHADGKGRSIWDVYTNDFHLTAPVIGRSDTGNVAANMYDRDQYLSDIALMKRLGVNAYRFSISWSRILPEGTGPINFAGLAHYSQLIDDLLANGIEPVVTIYHWDMPAALAARGGWTNPESIEWFKNYADILFAALGGRVKRFITVNEPFVELFVVGPSINSILEGVRERKSGTEQTYAREAVAAHHLLLANAEAIASYRQLGIKGEVGVSFNFTPTAPANRASEADIHAAVRMDAFQNRWFLDPIYKGRYPEELSSLYKAINPDFAPTEEEMRSIATNRPDFIGVNYYAPSYFKAEESAPLGATWAEARPEIPIAYNGPVEPEQLYGLLARLKAEYGDPVIYVTENGAGFGMPDEEVESDKIHDARRVDYIQRHVEAALRARRDGVNLRGYFVWSLVDNFEWTAGFSHRLGLVHVDFDTQRRVPKDSFFQYERLIALHPRG